MVFTSFLHFFCRAGGSHVQTEVKQPLLPVVCPLCKIEEIANQESESSSLPHAESVSLSVSDCYDHITRCHLSPPGIPRARFAKVAQFCCANSAPVARPFVVGNARRIEKHVPRRGSEGRKTQGWNLCSPKSVIESQKRADAWERNWRSDDGNGLSKYRKWVDWLWVNQFLEMENWRDPLERVTSTNSGEIQDANARPCSSGGCAEHQQAGTHPPQSLPPSKGIEQEGPAPPTNNERKLQSQLEHRCKREGKYI